jgi:hypothetical protein
MGMFAALERQQLLPLARNSNHYLVIMQLLAWHFMSINMIMSTSLMEKLRAQLRAPRK